MNENLFTWWIYPKGLQRPHDGIPLQASCPVLKIYKTESISEGPKEIHSQKENKGVLQLRPPFLQLFDVEEQRVTAFLRCSSEIHFSLRVPQVQREQEYSEGNRPQNGSISLSLWHHSSPHQRLTFIFRLTDLKALESLRIEMEKSSLAQPDFHHRFTPLRRLGRGAEATVYSAIKKKDSQVVAVKAFSKQITFSMQSNKGKEMVQKEIQILTQCRHENLCQLLGLYETENTIYIVMKQYAKTLASFLNTAQSVPRQLVVKIIQGLLKGLEVLHSKGIMHRDIKLQNIMIHNGRSGIVPILIDFGMSEYFQKEEYLFQHCGTPGYMAPEAFGNRGIHPQKRDVFSLGVVFYIMLFKKGVFSGNNRSQIICNNRAANLNLDMQLIDQEDDKIKDLLLKMLTIDTRLRITVRQSLQHSLFNPLTPVSEEGANSMLTPAMTSGSIQLDLPSQIEEI